MSINYNDKQIALKLLQNIAYSKNLKNYNKNIEILKNTTNK